jgi:hypothetical protein
MTIGNRHYLERMRQRQLLQPTFMEEEALTTPSPFAALLESSILPHCYCPYSRASNLKSDVAGNSFLFFPHLGSEEWGNENKNLDCN